MAYPPSRPYSEIIRMKMRTGDNPTGEKLTIREAARRTGYSYEHWRKVFKGETTYISHKFNERAARLLGLDKVEMWRLAEAEKVRARFGLDMETLPKGHGIGDIWAALTDENRARLADIGAVLSSHQESHHADRLR